MDTSPAVDLVVNCFERTYRDVLSPDTFSRIARMNRFRFARRTALVNNVEDKEHARTLGEDLIASGYIDSVVFVEDHLEQALERTGLSRSDLGRVRHFTDWALVAVCLPGPDYMLHWDAEVRLKEPTDWITPSLELMERDSRVLVANPNWPVPGDMENHAIEDAGDFSLGHGFSDQVFLARRSDMARPIYSTRSLARLRYPIAHLGHIFEARVDAYIRRSGKLRATYRRAMYEHPPEIGGSYPKRSPLETLRFARNILVTRLLRSVPAMLRPWSLKRM